MNHQDIPIHIIQVMYAQRHRLFQALVDEILRRNLPGFRDCAPPRLIQCLSLLYDGFLTDLHEGAPRTLVGLLRVVGHHQERRGIGVESLIQAVEASGMAINRLVMDCLRNDHASIAWWNEYLHRVVRESLQALTLGDRGRRVAIQAAHGSRATLQIIPLNRHTLLIHWIGVNTVQDLVGFVQQLNDRLETYPIDTIIFDLFQADLSVSPLGSVFLYILHLFQMPGIQLHLSGIRNSELLRLIRNLLGFDHITIHANLQSVFRAFDQSDCSEIAGPL